MYILYIDESENSSRSNELSPSVFGLSGLLITARYIPSFVENINRFNWTLTAVACVMVLPKAAASYALPVEIVEKVKIYKNRKNCLL